MQTLRGVYHRLFTAHGVPVLGSDFLANTVVETVGADRIGSLPIPKVSTQGTMPSEPSQGDGRRESKLLRALVALPLLATAALGLHLLNPTPMFPWVGEIIESGVLPWGGIPSKKSFYGAAIDQKYCCVLHVAMS